jgi:hypothetical protein
VIDRKRSAERTDMEIWFKNEITHEKGFMFSKRGEIPRLSLGSPFKFGR